MNNQPAVSSPLVISYLVLRKAIGYLGIALPFVLAIGGWLLYGEGIQSSISSYYHTGMRDIFVGTLCAFAVFLVSYKGYPEDDPAGNPPKISDDLAGNLAGFFAVGVALFPTTPDLDPKSLDEIIGGFHLAFAALFFLMLAYFSLCLFTRTDPKKPPTPQKLQRNIVYRVCGYAILAAIALIALLAFLPDAAVAGVKRLHPDFWLESLAILAFGVSWMTKGEAILKDET